MLFVEEEVFIGKHYIVMEIETEEAFIGKRHIVMEIKTKMKI